MPSADPTLGVSDDVCGSRRAPIILAAAGVACVAAGGLMWLDASKTPDRGVSDATHYVILGLWAAIAALYLFAHFRRSSKTEADLRRRADVMQARRTRLLALNAGFVGGVLTPAAMFAAARLTPGASLVERLSDAAWFLGPTLVTVALVTGFTFARNVGAVVEDELTSSHRARALGLGFAVSLIVGCAGLVVGLVRPDWAAAAMPASLGFGVAAAGLRFAWLERDASDRSDG